MLPLFPGEQIVTQSSEGAVTLTTHRICYEYRDWGRSYNQNIMLEHITSCENYYHAQVWLLVTAGLCLVGGLLAGANRDTSLLSVGILVALLLGMLYWFSRKNFIIISSPSTRMLIKVTGMKREQVLNFINSVEQAKHKRVLTINTK